MVCFMVKYKFTTKMVKSLQVNTLTIKKMVKELLNMKMELFFREFLKTTEPMDMVN